MPPASRQFPCSQCGAMLEFDPGTTSLKCVYCGWLNEIAPNAAATIDELSLDDHLRKLRDNASVTYSSPGVVNGSSAEFE